MYKDIVLCVHGIGCPSQNYAEKVDRRFDYGIRSSTNVISLNWEDKVSLAQKKQVNALNRLGHRWLRSKVINTIGDALLYQQTRVTPNMYEAINAHIGGCIDYYSYLYPDSNIHLVGHSLGGIILSNLLWDKIEHDKGYFNSKALNQIKSFITLGSPFALYSQKFADGGQALNLDKTNMTWYNIWNKSDLLSSPFLLDNKPVINASYTQPEIKDVEVKFGGLFTRWNISNHLFYWKDRKVIDKIEEIIGGTYRN